MLPNDGQQLPPWQSIGQMKKPMGGDLRFAKWLRGLIIKGSVV